jgi:hypothetical protein
MNRKLCHQAAFEHIILTNPLKHAKNEIRRDDTKHQLGYEVISA